MATLFSFLFFSSVFLIFLPDPAGLYNYKWTSLGGFLVMTGVMWSWRMQRMTDMVSLGGHSLLRARTPCPVLSLAWQSKDLRPSVIVPIEET
jgi:hypothetical protein